ncbi:hypothetical protein SVAN01_08142 [Stagonosporopsis vannaccii]|nr:hypothetical protein SVAN01_08142 [Stagonosporopsis vannaccii]
MEDALLAFHTLLGTTRSFATARPLTRPPSRKSSQTTPRRATSPHTPSTPATPRQSLTATTTPTPCAPRKRPVCDYDPSEPATPQKRTRRTPPTPASTPTKPRCSRNKMAIPLDKAVCIPMRVLRAQVDDPSALLRPLPRRSDGARKLVDLSIQRVVARLRALVATERMKSVVLVSGRKEGTVVEAAAGLERERREGGRKKS